MGNSAREARVLPLQKTDLAEQKQAGIDFTVAVQRSDEAVQLRIPGPLGNDLVDPVGVPTPVIGSCLQSQVRGDPRPVAVVDSGNFKGSDARIEWVKEPAVCVVVASKGYPDTPETGKVAAVGPAVVADASTWSVRAFPDGKRAIFWGRLAGEKDPARRVYVLDLATGRATAPATRSPRRPAGRCPSRNSSRSRMPSARRTCPSPAGHAGVRNRSPRNRS